MPRHKFRELRERLIREIPDALERMAETRWRAVAEIDAYGPVELNRQDAKEARIGQEQEGGSPESKDRDPPC